MTKLESWLVVLRALILPVEGAMATVGMRCHVPASQHAPPSHGSGSHDLHRGHAVVGSPAASGAGSAGGNFGCQAGQVMEAADASAELARRRVRAGNFSRLAQRREQTVSAEAAAQLARARHQAIDDRETLIRVLGLPGTSTQFTLPARLSDLPKAAAEPVDAERLSLERRLRRAARPALDRNPGHLARPDARDPHRRRLRARRREPERGRRAAHEHLSA